MALAALPMAANAAVAQPLSTCAGYSMDTVQLNSTAIKIDIVPQCAGEAAAPDPYIWEYVPISSSGNWIPVTVTSEPNNVVLLTYDCQGTAPDEYQVIAGQIGVYPIDEMVWDDCGVTTEP